MAFCTVNYMTVLSYITSVLITRMCSRYVMTRQCSSDDIWWDVCSYL